MPHLYVRLTADLEQGSNAPDAKVRQSGLEAAVLGLAGDGSFTAKAPDVEVVAWQAATRRLLSAS